MSYTSNELPSDNDVSCVAARLGNQLFAGDTSDVRRIFLNLVPVGRYAQALLLHEQFRQQGDLDAAKKCIEIYEELLEGHAAELASSLDQNQNGDLAGGRISRCQQYHTLIELASVYEDRFLYMEDNDDLDAALDHGQRALALCRAEDVVCPTVLVILSGALQQHAWYFSSSEEQCAAVEMCGEAISLCELGHPLIAIARAILAAVSYRRSLRNQSQLYPNEAVDLQRLAIEELPRSRNHDKHRYLRDLGCYLFSQWQIQARGDKGLLDASISTLEEAVRMCPDNHIDKAAAVRHMLVALHRNCELSGSLEDLNSAIKFGMGALPIGRPGGQPHPGTLNAVATLFGTRYIRTLMDERDIDQSIEFRREILKYTRERSHVRHWTSAANLAIDLRLRYASTGELGDLEEAIELCHEAMAANPDPSAQSSSSEALSHALMFRFAETRDIADLNDALKWNRRALSLREPSHLFYNEYAITRINQLCIRFETTGEQEDLEEAILLGESILQATWGDRAEIIDVIRQLSKALLFRCRYRRDITDAERALQILESVSTRILQRRDWPHSLRMLARGHLTVFRLTSDPQSANRSLDIIVKLLKDVPPGDHDQQECLIDAAELYMERNTPFRDPSLALQYLKRVLSDDSRDVRSRIQGVTRILDVIQAEHRDAFTVDDAASSCLLEIYMHIVSLLPRAAFFSLHLLSRLQSLRMGQHIAAVGAAHALKQSLPHQALEILEQGRAIFWTHSLRLRSSFDIVPEGIRDRLKSLARQLERVTDTSDTTRNDRATDAEIARRRKQSEEFNSILEEVRALPGLERFMLPETYPTLMKVADRGPVVVLVSSALACYALVLKPSGDIASIPLQQLDDAWLVQSGTAWRAAAMEARSLLRDRLKVSKVSTSRRAKTTVDDILRRLWLTVVQPVIAELGLQVSAGRSRPRVWWCPTDYLVSSYTPTLGVLLASRAAYTPVKKSDVRALIAAVPRSRMSQWDDLRSTSEEVDAVRRMLPEGAEIALADCRPEDESVTASGRPFAGITAQALLQELPQASLLHLACHGYQDPENPLKSGFVMKDKLLTIESLMPVPLPHAFMAFLSACETAKGDTNQPDQAVHLAAALLFAGFKSVIATLWSMEDADGPMVAAAVYEDIFSGDSEYIDPDVIPYALDAAVRRLRADHPEPSRWAPYIHLGI
ncbi:hypothetical protein PUNSTDRAFT_136629 [Punctularia strigosozonata HHB-11173 SS5]|uniref:uncharacterized protein n=1 Tax=Punctularia strigosozonata (strain HHB-11173) TaxID=741275 RepID=UPI0004416E64|nr:uncharacterized protein PUNSTDRAFT_136629 [Punctularia strigosozonata HHB-11173 SS5]EIN06799.1 hypothetical protein PUNSTDRAFT_136629 [Punctularia strigosozonata HHB-11173 SS5]